MQKLETNLSRRQVLSLFSLIMITVGSVDSIRNLPATALFGSNIISFLILAGVLFLIPSALVSAELSTRYADKAGVYSWVSHTLGNKTGFIAIWFQWIENVVWYPAILSYVAGTVAYVISPDLVENKIFVIIFVLVSFWLITLINIFGMKSSSWFANICTVFGLLLPMILIFSMGLFWIISGHHLQIDLKPRSLIPNFSDWHLWLTISGVMLSMCGMEIATVHTRETINPQKTFPLALLISVVIVFLTIIFGALSIAITIPSEQLSLIAGIMQTFHVFLSAFNLAWILPIIGLMLVIGGLGGVNNWIIAPTRGLQAAGLDGHLPRKLLVENQYGSPYRLLLIQAVTVTILMIVYLLVPSINGVYWYFNVLAAQLYMIMYALMFIAGMVSRYTNKTRATYQIPTRHGMYVVAILGLIGSFGTFIFGFFPPSGVHVGSNVTYIALIIVGIVIATVPPFILMQFNQKSMRVMKHAK